MSEIYKQMLAQRWVLARRDLIARMFQPVSSVGTITSAGLPMPPVLAGEGYKVAPGWIRCSAQDDGTASALVQDITITSIGVGEQTVVTTTDGVFVVSVEPGEGDGDPWQHGGWGRGE